MIIIKPDLVIKWANSNLVLHRVREHLCVFLRRLRTSLHFWIYLWLRVWICTCIVRVCDRGKCCRGKADIYIYIYGDVWLGMETAIIFLLAKKAEGKKHKHSPIHSLSPPYSLSRTHSVQLSPSLFLYHLQRLPFPPKWGHVRKVCKWNHCSWIRMGHHIP